MRKSRLDYPSLKRTNLINDARNKPYRRCGCHGFRPITLATSCCPMCSAAREELSVSFYRNVQNYSAERIIWLKLIKINKYKTRKNVTEEKNTK